MQGDSFIANIDEKSGRRSKAAKKLIEEKKPQNITLTVGQATVESDVVHPQVATIRYGAVMFCMMILTAVSGWKLGWSLSFVLIAFAASSLIAIISLTLIETKQVQGVLNALLDYFLNTRRLNQDFAINEKQLDAAQMLDFYELRHRQLIERQAFILDNQVNIWNLLKGDDGESMAAKSLISAVARSGTPGAFVDTMVEDQIAETMMAYTVTLMDVNPKGERFKLRKDGTILETVPWSLGGGMTDEDRAIALKILQTISSRKAPLMEEMEDGQWKLNLKSYGKPIQIVQAFDAIYE